MSGSAGNVWKLRLTTEGAEKVVQDLRTIARESEAGKRVYDELSKSGLTLAGSTERTTQALNANVEAMKQARTAGGAMAAANDEIAQTTARLSGGLQTAGAFVKSFAAEVQGGGNALLAFGQQSSQFLALFGVGGAIAGAALTLGTAALSSAMFREETVTLSAAISAQKDVLEQATQAASRYSSGIETQATALLTLTAGYRAATEAARTFDATRLSAAQSSLALQRGTLDTRILGNLLDRTSATVSTPMSTPMGDFGGAFEQARQLTPGMEQLRQALADFGAQAVVTSDSIATLYNRLTTLDTGSASVNATMRQAAAALAAQAPEYLRIADAQREGAVQMLALREAAGASREELDRYAASFGNLAVQVRAAGASLNALRQGAIGTAEDRVAGEIQRNQAILEAVRTGGREAGVALRDSGARADQIQQRAQGLMDARQRELVAAGRTPEDARDEVRALQGEFTTLASIAVDTGRAVSGALAETARSAGSARTAAEQLTEGQRQYQQIVGQAEAAISAARTEEEKRSDVLILLNRLTAEGTITEAERARAVELTARAEEIARNAASQRAAERQAQEDSRKAEQAAQQIERANQASIDNIVKYSGDRFADLFDKNKDGWKGMLQTFESTAKSTIGRIAAELILRPIITPVVNYLGLGSIASRSGLAGLSGSGLGLGGSGLGAGGVVTDGNGGIIGQIGNLSSSSTISRGLGGFNPGDYMSGAKSFSTGFSGVDGFLNTPIWGGASAGINAGGSITNAAGYGSMAANSIDAAGSASAAGVGSNVGTIGSAGLAGLGVAGGLYGAINGFDRGGVGGYTQAAGGAATAGLSAAAMAGLAVPVYGWIAAAVLSIVGALLPGQKPSGRGQEFRVDLLSGDTEKNGLRGDRYSAQNASQAETAARSIANLSTSLSAALGNARIPGEAAVGVTSSRGDGPGTLYLEVAGRKAQFANSEEGAKELADQAAKFLLEAFRGAVSGDFVGILNASPTVEKLQENLTWYTDVYQQFGKTGEAASAFQQQLDQVTASFQASVDKANELALATDVVTTARDKELARLTAARDLNVKAYGIGLDIRLANATGVGGLEPQLAAFDINREQGLAQAREQLEAWGLDAVRVSEMLAKTDAVYAAERLKIQQDFGAEAAAEAERQAKQIADEQKQSAQSVIDWLNGEALGATSGLSPTARLSEAERQYNAALASGDSAALTRSASALLDATGGVYSTASRTYQERRGFIRQGVANAGARDAQGSGDANLIAALQQMAVLQGQQLAALAAKFDDVSAELRRSNDLRSIAA